MANTTFVGGLIALFSLFSLVGCQTNAPVVESLPAPNFNAPRLTEARPPAPVPTALPPVPPSIPQHAPAPAPRPEAEANAARGWVPPVAPRPWRWIIIHHSATTTGGAAAFDKMHRAKGWDELGYDFVIGNGTDTRDGQIEVGSRWNKQKIGAHDKTPDNRYNEYGIGICLVGNFDVERPTPKQIQSLVRLTAYLMKTYHITPDCVKGHGQTKATDCPGKYMDVAMIRRLAARLAGVHTVADTGEAAANRELLTRIPKRQ
jgi:hypothetical protein